MEIADHQETLVPTTFEGDDVFTVPIRWDHISKPDGISIEGWRQGRQLAIVIQDGIWILFLVFHIDGSIWFGLINQTGPSLKPNPGSADHCMVNSCIVPAVFGNRGQGFFLGQTSFFRHMVAIDSRDIIKSSTDSKTWFSFQFLDLGR